MSQKKIAAARKRIQKRLFQAYEDLKALQAECKHPGATKEYGGSTGNYDPNNDCYWIDWDCQDCGKHWMVGQ